MRRTGRTPSGREWQGAQSRQGVTELGFPGPTLGQMQSEAARRAGEPSGQGEEGFGGYQRRRRVLVVTNASPRPMRPVQRAKLWAMTWTTSQAPLAGKRPEGRWLSPIGFPPVSSVLYSKFAGKST